MKDKLINQILERKDLIDLVTNAGVAYTGYQATRHWMGALTGIVAFKLAQAPNLPASVAGVATLAALGISAGSSAPGIETYVPAIIEKSQEVGMREALVTSTIMTQKECLDSGGTIMSILPPTNLCLCSPPTPPPTEEPPEYGGGGGGTIRR